MCVVRELLGSGTFGGGLIDIANGFRFTLDGTGAGIQIFNPEYGATILVLPFGGFLTLGVPDRCHAVCAQKVRKEKAACRRSCRGREKGGGMNNVSSNIISISLGAILIE